MPQSKVRKEAAEKKVAKNKAKARAEEAKSQAKLAAGTRDWVPWAFILARSGWRAAAAGLCTSPGNQVP